MIFYFTLKGDSLKLLDLKTEAKTGNVNSYTCQFQTDDDWSDLKVFASFKSGNNVYTVALSDDFSCTIPSELLLESGKFFIGLYATNFNNENFKRISTNWVTLDVKDGAYVENSTSPAIPTPDFWEVLSSRMIPKIGENGNWFIWDMEDMKYQDTKVSAKAPAEPSLLTDLRYLLKNNAISTGSSIENVNDYIPASPVIDYRIEGNSYQEKFPTLNEAQSISFVGNPVSDTDSKYFGKYHIPYTFSGTEHSLYLDEPLRSIKYCGTNQNSIIGQYDYFSDHIDFKSKQLVRNVGELIIDDVSLIGEVDDTGFLSNDKLWVRTILSVPDMTTLHPYGKWVEGNILSNRLQPYKKSLSTVLATDNYITTINNHNKLFFYWDLSLLGFSYEVCNSTDYFIETLSGVYYKVKDENSNYLTDFSQITEHIFKLYSDNPIKVYYPLSSPKVESVELPTLFMPESGTVDFLVNTELVPREIHLSYCVDITEKFTELKKRVDDLETAVLSMGANIG